jgi:uncharacterized protein YbaR (Trm112 family)
MFESLLACPRCDKALQDLRCSACKVEFPLRDGVPWLFSEPDAAMTEWHNRWQLALAQLDQDAKRTEAAVKVATSAATRERLVHLRDGYRKQHSLLTQMLLPLQLTSNANLEALLALRTRLPTQQGLTSYAANAFRDWSWGDAENTASITAIQQALGPHQPQSILVLGAGAGRLAYDLHQACGPEVTVALDNNPLFSYLTEQIARGEKPTLVEFPLAPRNPEDCAIERTLAAPAPALPGFHAVLADGLRCPFVPGAFDLVVTPWFLDVVPQSPTELVPRLNRLLADDGIWINHGSVAFSSADPGQRLSLVELEEVIEQCGFTDVASSEQLTPYMDCPESRHGRMESVVTLSARKQANVDQPPRFQALPEWIVAGREPVPALPAFQSQAMSTRIHAFIMSLIDGKRSLKDMAKLMEEQQLMPAKEAEAAIRGFLIKMFEEASSSRGY